jgi:hypothetical protein
VGLTAAHLDIPVRDPMRHSRRSPTGASRSPRRLPQVPATEQLPPPPPLPAAGRLELTGWRQLPAPSAEVVPLLVPQQLQLAQPAPQVAAAPLQDVPPGLGGLE